MHAKVASCGVQLLESGTEDVLVLRNRGRRVFCLRWRYCHECHQAKGEEAKQAYEKVMAEEFTKLLPVIEQKKITFKDLIEAGLFNGMRVNTEKKDKD